MISMTQTFKRGCGKRVQGGVYSSCGTSPFGKPVEAFLKCPPVLVDAKAVGIAPVGVKVIDGNVWDWVGSKYYPNVTDFIEEVRRFGMSRRLPKTMDFSSLHEGSMQILLHSSAWISDPSPHFSQRIGGEVMGYDWPLCPIGKLHEDPKEMCAGLWWEDIEKKQIENKTKRIGPQYYDRIGTRVMPSFEYTAAETPENNFSDYRLAIFASFPIKNIDVISAEDGSHNDTVERIAKSTSIHVEVCDE